MRNIETTPNMAALLAGAGYAPAIPSAPGDADIIVERADEDSWTVTMVSPRAVAWAKADLCCVLRQCFAGRMRLDMMSTDRLLKQAHERGLKSEFTGHNGKDLY